jgi:uncharacterized protein
MNANSTSPIYICNPQQALCIPLSAIRNKPSSLRNPQSEIRNPKFQQLLPPSSRQSLNLQKTETMLLPREQALELLNKFIKNERMIAHSLASEAVMRALAQHLGRNVDQWGQAGLLHDIDVEVTNADARIHGPEGAKWLAEMGVDGEVTDAIAMHNEMAAGKERSTEFQYALAAGETITGLITATTYVYPDRKLTSVKPKSVVKRMKEKAFAASVKRENIMECEKIGIPIDEFAAIAIAAMIPIAEEIGL